MVKFDYQIYGKLNYVGLLSFPKMNEIESNSCLIVGKLGEIYEMTESLKYFFNKNNTIFHYNKDIKEIFSALNELAAFKLDNKEVGDNLANLVKDNKLMKSWNITCRLRNHQKYLFNTMTGWIQFKIKICDYCINQMGDWVRFLQLDKNRNIDEYLEIEQDKYQKDIENIFSYFDETKLKKDDMESVRSLNTRSVVDYCNRESFTTNLNSESF